MKHNRIMRETDAGTWRANCTCLWCSNKCHTQITDALIEGAQHVSDQEAFTRLAREESQRVPDASESHRMSSDTTTGGEDDDSTSQDDQTSTSRALNRVADALERRNSFL